MENDGAKVNEADVNKSNDDHVKETDVNKKTRANKGVRKALLTALIIILVIILTLGALFMFKGYNINSLFGGAFNKDETSGILIDHKTNEETVYSLEILKKDEVNGSIKSWIEKSITADNAAKNTADEENDAAYYTLYNNSSEGMEMYLFMPSANEIMGDIGMSNIKVAEAGTTLVMYIDTNNKTGHKKDSTDLILHVYVSGDIEKARAQSEQLIINEKTYAFASATYTELGTGN